MQNNAKSTLKVRYHTRNRAHEEDISERRDPRIAKTQEKFRNMASAKDSKAAAPAAAAEEELVI